MVTTVMIGLIMGMEVMILMGITIGMVDIQKMNLIIGKVHGMGAGCMDWGMFILMLIFMVTKEGLARVIMALVTIYDPSIISDKPEDKSYKVHVGRIKTMYKVK